MRRELKGYGSRWMQGLKDSAALLLTVSCFMLLSCSESDSPVDNGGGNSYNPATGMVRASVILSVAAGNEMLLTRSTGTAVQLPAATDGSNSLGMTDMTLFAMQGDPQYNDFSGATQYPLGTIARNTLGNSEETPSSRIYDLQMPVGTDNLVFYSRVIKQDNSLASNENQGLVDFHVGKTKDDIHFSLQPRLTAGTTEFDRCASDMEALLTDVATADNGTYNLPTAAQSAGAALLPLKEAFQLICRTDDLHAGSGAAISALMTDVYARMQALLSDPAYASPAPGSDEEQAVALATLIISKVDGYFNIDTTGALVFKDASLQAFPSTQMRLPDGMARLTCTLDGAGIPTFAYVQADGTSAQLAAPVWAAANTTYPAEMLYWCSSPIFTTDQSVTDNDIPKTTEELDHAGREGNGYNDNHHEGENMASGNVEWTAGSEVSETTKGVLMQNNINYGTALLQSVVQYADGGPGVTSVNLTDNRSSFVSGASDATLTITSESDFPIKGIMLVGIPQTVEWDMTAPFATFGHIIYDNVMEADGVHIDGSTVPNCYTMVWDTYRRVKAGTAPLTDADRISESNGQESVIAVLELLNNVQDFYGANGLIRKGQHFYLSVEMSPKYRTVYGWPTGTYRYPPLKDDGTGADITRVFIQDFITRATFSISATTLQHASDTPRPPSDNGSAPPTLGLTVDLSWSVGMDFDKEL